MRNLEFGKFIIVVVGQSTSRDNRPGVIIGLWGEIIDLA
jgi:hypothetical protein